MTKAHLDVLPFICAFELQRTGERTGIVSRRLVRIAQNAALRLFRTAFRLQWADVAIRLSGDVAKCVVGLQGAGRSQDLAVRAGIKILFGIIFPSLASFSLMPPGPCGGSTRSFVQHREAALMPDRIGRLDVAGRIQPRYLFGCQPPAYRADVLDELLLIASADDDAGNGRAP